MPRGWQSSREHETWTWSDTTRQYDEVKRWFGTFKFKKPTTCTFNLILVTWSLIYNQFNSLNTSDFTDFHCFISTSKSNNGHHVSESRFRTRSTYRNVLKPNISTTSDGERPPEHKGTNIREEVNNSLWPKMIEGADKIVTKCSTNSRNEQRVDRRVGGWPPNQSRDVDMFGFSLPPSPWISRRLQYSCHHILAPKWDSVMTLHSVSGSLFHTRQRKSNDSTLRSVSDPSAENLVPLTSSCDWTQILIMLDVNASRSLTQPSGLLLLYIYSR